ncbi:MAG: hypothetical protein WD845_13260 [Pirellulales bacterium]
MAILVKPNWRWRISLRMLLAVVGALALFLGYHVNWLHERHALLAKYDYLAASAGAESEFLRDEWRWRNPAETSVEPPGLLGLFGERGVEELWLVFYSDDPAHAAAERATEFGRAKRLFPEADIWFSEFPRDPHQRLGRALQYRHAAN